MATDVTSPAPGEQPEPEKKREGPKPITAAERKVLQAIHTAAGQKFKADQFDYANELYTKLILKDPGNLVYLKDFIANLQKKYGNNKKGSKLAAITGAGHKANIKKSQLQKKWLAVIEAGVKMLALNPWDTFTLTAMSVACFEMGLDQCELQYLRAALDANTKDAEINRLCGRALGRQGFFDQAIICWHRVEQAKPGDEEAPRAIAELGVQKTIKEGVRVETEKQKKAAADAAQAASATTEPKEDAAFEKLNRVKRMEDEIAKDPANPSRYIELADLHISQERFEPAEAALHKALEVSGGDVNVRERLEDVQIRRAKEHVKIAEQKAQQDKTDEAKALWNKMRAALNAKEVDVFRSRCDRYPSNLTYKFELATRLKRGGNFKEAIKYFQETREDPKRRGQVKLELGECFQRIEQYSLAMRNYEEAIQEIPEKELDFKKQALYNAGRLAMGLKDFDTADRHLTALAALDFAYKDVSDRLGKLAQVRHNQGESPAADD